MPEERKERPEDDLVVADMSNVAGSGMGSLFKGRSPRRDAGGPQPASSQEIMTPQERRWYILGTLKAALLIGSAYAVGIGLVVLIFLWAASKL